MFSPLLSVVVVRPASGLHQRRKDVMPGYHPEEGVAICHQLLQGGIAETLGKPADLRVSRSIEQPGVMDGDSLVIVRTAVEDRSPQPPVTPLCIPLLRHILSQTLRPEIGNRCAQSPPQQSKRSSDGPEMVEVSRSEEHTSELQSRGHLVCRLLL